MSKLSEYWDAVYSCMGCGDCGYAIHSAIGKFKSCPVKEVHESPFEVYFARGKMRIAKGILDGKLPLSKELAEIIYQCTECGACHDTCHQTHNPHIDLFVTRWIDHVEVWEALRQDLVKEGFAPLDQHARILKSMNDQSRLNPYERELSEKQEAISNLNGFVDEGTSEIGFFAGCTQSLMYSETLQKLGKIIEKSGVKVCKLPNEYCCGSIALRIGDMETATHLMEQNIKYFQDLGIKQVITACAGCYRTLKKDYPKYSDKELPEIINITEFLEELIEKQKIQFNSTEPISVTYHDPCHLGRHMKIYDPPRNVIKAIPGVSLIEMKRNRNNAWCCGAGGGLKSQFPKMAVDIAKDRISEAIETQSSLLVTSCPFCERNLTDAISQDEELKVVDIIDLIFSRI